ncbi:MAG: hypothetical protein QME59_05550 [Candidatus Hydrothermarchaeota archaeon]|nr:hypothetical protein [Candidatus Hydrothermarchaeota archaeon]
MKTDIGEYIVGACLKIIKECDFVDYNVRPPGGGLEGLNELDVVGLKFKNKTAYLCEVTTHIRGLLYKDNRTTVERIKTKYERMNEYANKHLSDFPNRYFMFWSPVVPKGYITSELEKIDGLELVINERYTQYIDELRKKAKELTNDVGNPCFRMLQILEHLRR